MGIGNEGVIQVMDVPAARWTARPERQGNGADGEMVVVLEPDLARVFKTPERVQVILRAIAGILAPQMLENPGR